MRCGQPFYVEEPEKESNEIIMSSDNPDSNDTVEDPDALRRAEEELKRAADESDDHTCW